jgi:hypothetical protein
MGLDSTLYARKYVAGNDYYPVEPEAYDEVIKAIELHQDELHPDMKSAYITIPIAYWRKSWAIHNWFVQNVQEGNDDCHEYYVQKGQLEELYNICKKVLEDNRPATSKELLPIEGNDYDQYYYADVKRTVDQIEPYITSTKFGMRNGFEFTYRASW